MRNLINRLKKRGWKKREIAKAVSIIRKAKQNKTKENLFLEKRIYWVLLFVIIAANFAISVALMPILIALKGIFLYSIIIIFGAVFGLLFELVIRSIEHLEKKHHVILSISIPLIALSNIFVISKISNDLTSKFGLANLHNPIIISTVYAISFVLPYMIYRFIFRIEFYAN